jgi:general secretion pathway protein K
MRRARAGFALLAVLWVTVSVATLALAVSLAARSAIATAANRTEITRATWRAEGCAEEARATMADIVTAAPQTGWDELDTRVRVAGHTSVACTVALAPAGNRLNVNLADGASLTALFARLGISPARRDSLVAALLDWRDSDDDPRPFGAEQAWYAKQHRLTPRNGPLSDVGELVRVRGFEAIGGLDSVLGIEPGRIALNHAPLSVLAALPGFGDEALNRVQEMRFRNEPVSDLLAFAGRLSPDARDVFLSQYSDLVRLTTIEPDAWILQAQASSGTPRLTVTIELRLVRSGGRIAIARVREWTS